ncbi:citrate lyase acyl carrier protein [Neobacillus cucumis]|jgi:citrate lyase subunit gamma (acyl carrier protein)|uniref:citrate lyase acyl carrier protein n=2 Tax=Neobacillus cucumis TaxID=1740721 RepID=UPI001962A7C2|nr:citrate lyase acyl carrier protein [Neobacillus cucumis]MBM7653858.1 citrate lyase subunit gamma (acyl carrier protein) [Neobacillus cucumis]
MLMMPERVKILDAGIAGTLESSDITIQIEQNDRNGIELELKSTVENQFGSQIRKVILETLLELGVGAAIVRANDKGALDCTIRARVRTAVRRATHQNCFPWEVK